VYAADDDGRIRNGGIFVDATYEDAALRANCPGFATYPHGYIYTDQRLWGPNSASPVLAHPDPLVIVQDHWNWIQTQQDSDLGVQVVGDLKSTVRIGSYEEPYRLVSWEVPDLGAEIDNLAQATPFDYVEEHAWVDPDTRQAVSHTIRLGWPRLGGRSSLRFAEGENIIAPLTAATSAGGFANDVIGIGNGEGRSMVQSRSTVRDGRLRRQRVVTDKTRGQASMDRLTQAIRLRSADTLDIASVTVRDHPNAPLSALEVGDDIWVEGTVPAYGDVELWVRVLSITEDDTGDVAVLATTRSSAFIYSSTVEVNV
jgi:hypothetical protein